MHNKTNLCRLAAAGLAGFILGGIALHFPTHTAAWAADGPVEDLTAGRGAAVTAIPLQLGRDSFGLAMVDTENQTLWIYEIAGRKPGLSQLRLLAARSWKYDRQLTEFNSGDPSPQYIKNFLENVKSSKPETDSPALETQAP